MTIDLNALATPDGTLHFARLDLQGRAFPMGEPTGFFHDGWVRAQAAFTFRALDRISSMSLDIWSYPDPEPLSLTVKAPGQPEVTLTAPAGRIAVLQFALHVEPSTECTVELIANREGPLSAEDRRRASYKLRCIGLY